MRVILLTLPALFELLLIGKHHSSCVSGFNHVCQARFFFNTLLVFAEIIELLAELQVERFPQNFECYSQSCFCSIGNQ